MAPGAADALARVFTAEFADTEQLGVAYGARGRMIPACNHEGVRMAKKHESDWNRHILPEPVENGARAISGFDAPLPPGCAKARRAPKLPG